MKKLKFRDSISRIIRRCGNCLKVIHIGERYFTEKSLLKPVCRFCVEEIKNSQQNKNTQQTCSNKDLFCPSKQGELVLLTCKK